MKTVRTEVSVWVDGTPSFRHAITFTGNKLQNESAEFRALHDLIDKQLDKIKVVAAYRLDGKRS